MKAKLVNESLNEYKGRVERNARKKLRKIPGLFHDGDGEEDKYVGMLGDEEECAGNLRRLLGSKRKRK